MVFGSKGRKGENLDFVSYGSLGESGIPLKNKLPFELKNINGSVTGLYAYPVDNEVRVRLDYNQKAYGFIVGRDMKQMSVISEVNRFGVDIPKLNGTKKYFELFFNRGVDDSTFTYLSYESEFSEELKKIVDNNPALNNPPSLEDLMKLQVKKGKSDTFYDSYS